MKIGDKKSLSDALQSQHTSQPERFTLGSDPVRVIGSKLTRKD